MQVALCEKHFSDVHLEVKSNVYYLKSVFATMQARIQVIKQNLTLMECSI